MIHVIPLLGIITTSRARTGTTLPACLTGTLAAGLEAAGRGLATLGSNVALRGRQLTCIFVAQARGAHTCFSGSMLAKPPLWLAWPPLDAISRTSSLGLWRKGC